MARFDAILFDFDGVLLDSEPIHFSCWQEVVQQIGISITWEEYKKHCIGFHDDVVTTFLAGLATPPVPPQVVRAQYPLKRELFIRKAVQSPPFPHLLVEFLNSLSAYRLAVVTSSQRSEIEPVLQAGGIRSLFQVVICAADVARHKPAPDPYLEAASLLGASMPLVVEDSELGIQSARAAGFEVIRVSGPAEVPEKVLARLNL